MKHRLVYIAIIVIAIAIMLVPLFTKNHIYQGVALGGDTKNTFIPLINLAMSGESLLNMVETTFYPGLGITMWALGNVNKLLNMNPELLFYLYSALILFIAGITLYYLGKFAGGKRVGWLVLVMGMLCSTTILALFSWACIVNIINVYILFLWGVALVARWDKYRKWYYLLSGMVLLITFSLLHPTGVYLPLSIIVALCGLIVWATIKEKNIQWRYIIIGGLLFVVSIYPALFNINRISLNPSLETTSIGYGDYFIQFLRLFFAPIPTVIAILVGVAYLRNRRSIQLSRQMKFMLLVLASLLVVLDGAAILRVTSMLERQILDASAIFTIIVALLLSQLIKNKELEWLRVSSYALISLGSLVTIMAWVR